MYPSLDSENPNCATVHDHLSGRFCNTYIQKGDPYIKMFSTLSGVSTVHRLRVPRTEVH